MKISIIVAVAKNNVIGHKNKLPWHIPADLARFKKITTNHHVLMGQKTYESIGKPLPNRTNVVLTDDEKFNPKGCKMAHSIDEAIKLAKKSKEEELMVIGGASVYQQLLPLAHRIYLTKINKTCKGDAYFPEIDMTKWKVSKEDNQKKNTGKIDYVFLTLERKT